MAKTQTYDEFVDDILADFVNASDDATKQIITRLQTWVAENSDKFNIKKPKGDKVTPATLTAYNNAQARAMAESLRQIEQVITEAVKGSNYPETLKGLFRKSSELESYASQALIKNGKWPAKLAKALDAVGIGAERELFVQGLTNDLNSAFSSEAMQPIRTAIAYNIRAGATTSQTTAFLDGLLLKKPGQEYAKMARYTTQIVNDAVLGYDGAIMQRFADEYGVNEWRYTGTLINDSRPFCVHCVSALGGKIPDKDLDKLLKKYLSSKSLSQGMRPGTNRKNFASYRGGYRCRHRVFPVYLS